MRDVMAGAGLQAKLDPYPVRVFHLKRCEVRTGEMVFEADPEWYPTATGPSPVIAPLATLDEGEPLEKLRGKIWLTTNNPRSEVLSADLKQKIDAAGRAGAVGAIVIVHHRSWELPGRNSSSRFNQAPWCSIPLVGVSLRAREPLMWAARQSAEASVLIDGRDQKDGVAYNAMAYGGEGDKIIVVTTPSSGLFRCGGERAPGVALFLGIAEWVGQRQPNARYIFSANSGHELMGMGAQHLVQHGVPAPEEVTAWLHLGSGAGVWRWTMEAATLLPTSPRGGINHFRASPELIPILEKSFAHIPDLTTLSGHMGGELGYYMREGYTSFGFSGSNTYRHTVADGPEQTSPELLAPLALGLADALEAIEKM
jgi:hypothetical protein